MEKLKAEDQTDYKKMYVYFTSMFEDLIEAVTEYLGEVEHSGEDAECGEISSDTIEDVQKWCETRKKLLIKDFIDYWSIAFED